MEKSAIHARHAGPAVSKPGFRQRGFSLIETMVVVVILAVIAALAGPSMVDMLRDNRLQASAAALQSSLSLARSEAVKRGGDTLVTVAANTTAGTWTNGWTVFVDGTGTANLGVAPTADSGSVTRLEVAPQLQAGISHGDSSSLNYFSYNSSGRAVTATGAAGANRAFWFHSGTSKKFCVVISLSGRVRSVSVDSASSCPTSG
ncbi:MAG: Type secretion system protein precursor [Pseudomonadota bacterium]|jgi:type IV fimbrial biogenesis protein FimT